ncbi:hypothetical protein [Guyparkeria sp.]|uniref:hypothetical protein n=1 Tax=Guyparkeria sp. TaxID=2035736 RepID=UPI003970CF21
MPALANTTLLFLVAVIANDPGLVAALPDRLGPMGRSPGPPLTYKHLQAALHDLNMVPDIMPAEPDTISSSAIAHAARRALRPCRGRLHGGEFITTHKRFESDDASPGRGRTTLNLVRGDNETDSEARDRSID